MKTNYSILLALAGLLTVLPSCKWATKSIDDTLHGRPTVDNTDYMASAYKGSDNFLTNPQALNDAEKALRNLTELKGKQIKLYNDAQFYDDGRIMIQVIDPDTANNVNEYDFNGQEWGPKKPVQISSSDISQMGLQTFALDTMPFSRIAKLAATYAQKAKQNNSTSAVSHIYYVPEAGEWYCNDMETPRANYQLFFSPDGRVKEFKRE